MQIGLRASPHVTVAGRKYKVLLSGPGPGTMAGRRDHHHHIIIIPKYESTKYCFRDRAPGVVIIIIIIIIIIIPKYEVVITPSLPSSLVGKSRK